MVYWLQVSLKPNHGLEFLCHFSKYVDWLSSECPDSSNFLSIKGNCGNKEPFRRKPFRIVSIFEFDKDMLREHDDVDEISSMQLVHAGWRMIEEDEVT